MNFRFPAPWGLWGGAKSVKIDQFKKKSSSLKLHVFKKNYVHGDVEQEDLYRNCEFHYLRGRGFAPRAGSNMIYSVC